ncbi:Pkinase-domain-containing protein, partial [Fistulina hepatica ATCC 64428]
MIGIWKMGRTIGQGSSGESTFRRVKLARHSRTGKLAAIKIVSKSHLNTQVSLRNLADEVDRAKHVLEREIAVMKLLDHPNILRFYDVWETSTDIYLIIEYVRGGELFDYICQKGRLETEEALDYFQQIIGALEYCHAYSIAHRDLKPENILLDEDLNVKIADFGMATLQRDDLLHTSCGSPHYAAPEIIRNDAYDGAAADVWSCGVILHAMVAGRLPFDDDDLETLLNKVKDGDFEMPDDIEPLVQDLLAKMLVKDFKKRITLTAIKKHPFFTSRPPKHSAIATPLDQRPVDIIDSTLFEAMKILWHGIPEAALRKNLQSKARTWEKGIYHLL